MKQLSLIATTSKPFQEWYERTIPVPNHHEHRFTGFQEYLGYLMVQARRKLNNDTTIADIVRPELRDWPVFEVEAEFNRKLADLRLHGMRREWPATTLCNRYPWAAFLLRQPVAEHYNTVIINFDNPRVFSVFMSDGKPGGRWIMSVTPRTTNRFSSYGRQLVSSSDYTDWRRISDGGEVLGIGFSLLHRMKEVKPESPWFGATEVIPGTVS